MNIFDNVIHNDFDYILSSLGQMLFIDNRLVKAWVKNTKVSNGYHERGVIAKDKFTRGSIVDFEGERYLVLSDTMEKKYGKYFKGNMRLINQLIYFKVGGKDYFFPSAVETEGMSLKTLSGSILTLADGGMVVVLQANELTNMIKINDKFFTMDIGWEVLGVDKSFEGLVKLHCKNTTVAEGVKNPPSGTQEYPTRPSDPSTPRGSITVKYEGDTILGKEVIDNLELKEHIINAKEFEGYNLVGTSSKTVTLTEENPNQEVVFNYEKIEEVIPVEYIIIVDGMDEVFANDMSQFNAVVKADGEIVTDKLVKWEVIGVGGSPTLSTISKTGLLRSGSEVEELVITVRLIENHSVYTEKKVTILEDPWGWG